MTSTKKSPEFIKITEEDLIEAGMLPRKPKSRESKAGCPVKEPTFSLIKIDEKYLEELRLEAAQCDYSNFSIGLKKTNSSKKNEGSNTLYKMKRSSAISRRSSNISKDIVKKALNNMGNVSNNCSQKNERVKFTPDMLGTLEEDSRQGNARKKLFITNSFKNNISTKLFKGSRNSTTSHHRSSPLLNINKCQTSLKKSNSTKTSDQKYPSVINTPSRLSVVQEERNSITPSKAGNTNKNSSLRSSTSSNTEFEMMEQMCKQQDTKETRNSINKILHIMKLDQDEFKAFRDAHDRRMLDITNILKEIIESPANSVFTKESEMKPKTPKKTPVKSNNISNNVEDLRKNVLKMNIGKVLGHTPKREKAEKMYNGLRDVYGILETPKFDKIPRGDSKNISTKLQEQCLMLLDTPQHK